MSDVPAGRRAIWPPPELDVTFPQEAGRKVLVATSAAEEGLDVPSCEFVVRYNAAATGIQLLQSRGRARQRVAEFCAILQVGVHWWAGDCRGGVYSNKPWGSGARGAASERCFSSGSLRSLRGSLHSTA